MVAEVVGTSGGLEPIKPGPNRLFMDTCQIPHSTLHSVLHSQLCPQSKILRAILPKQRLCTKFILYFKHSYCIRVLCLGCTPHSVVVVNLQSKVQWSRSQKPKEKHLLPNYEPNCIPWGLNSEKRMDVFGLCLGIPLKKS